MKNTVFNTVKFTGKLTAVSAHTDQSITLAQCPWQNRGNGFYSGTLFQNKDAWIEVRIPDYYYEEHKDELTGNPGFWYHAFGTLETEVCRGIGVVHLYLKVTDIQAAENCDVD